jgi:competence protein ComEC
MAVVLAAGIAASDALGWPPSISYALLVLSFIAALVLRRAGSAAADAALLVSLSFGGMTWYADVTRAASAARPGPTGPGVELPFTARIVDPPVQRERSWSCIADVRLPHELMCDRPVVRARISVPREGDRSASLHPEVGDVWLLRGSVEPFPRPRNPGEMDYGSVLSMSGIDVVIRAREAVRVPTTEGFHPHLVLGRVQSLAYTSIDRLHAGDRAAFLKGVILGYRADLAEDLRSAFLATGTVHILAVSGGNVALIALVALVTAGLVRLRRRAAFGAAVISVLFYAWVTGSSPSVVRASIMAIVVLTSGVTGRRADVFQSLAVAAVLLLLLDPRSLFDVGFQLSFISVLAIVIGSPLLEPWLNRLPEEFRDHDVVRAVVQLLAVSAAAQVGTLPLTMSIFGQISLVSVVANLAVVPLSGAALVFGVIELLVMPLSTWAASVYAGVNDLVMDLLLGIVRTGASVPMAAVGSTRPDPWTMATLYAFLGVIASGTLPGLRRGLLACACALSVVAIWRPIVAGDRPLAQVITIDVGQGDAHLIKTFGGANILVDTGPSEFAADRTIVPLLQRLGVKALDEVVITHGHRDHAGGLGRLLDRLPVRTLTLSDSVEAGPEILRLVRSKGVRVRTVRRGEQVSVDPSVRLYVLHPGPVPVSRSANDRSVVIRLLAGEASMLLTGDLEEDGEDEVLRRYGDFVRSDVLKVAHHGSNTGTTPRWLDRVRPEQAVISVGRGNSFGHPSPERLSLFHERRIIVTLTMEEGAAWLTTDGRRWRKHVWGRFDH